MRGGQQSSPPDKVGLASLSLATQRSSGSTTTPGSELDEALEEVAASIECRAGKQAFNVDFSLAAEDVDFVLGKVTELLRYAAMQ
jgi:hypothetical protein